MFLVQLSIIRSSSLTKFNGKPYRVAIDVSSHTQDNLVQIKKQTASIVLRCVSPAVCPARLLREQSSTSRTNVSKKNIKLA